jgi:diphthamide synthase (EF-2-diphthine--ammonia ligase)
VLGSEFVGRNVDDEFLGALPPDVDPCGENGEFHTFCYDGPIFNQPIPFAIGKTIFRDYRTTQETLPTKENLPYGFWYCDLKPV